MSQHPHLQYHRWDGIFGADFTLDALRRRCRRLADLLVARGWSCLVAADTRFMASQFALDACRLLDASGVRYGYCATPAPLPAVERALEQRRYDCALVISAGNRPYWYGGLVILTPPIDRQLLSGELAPPAIDFAFPAPNEDAEKQHAFDLRTLYLESLRSAADIDLIRRASLTLFVDPMNGTTSGYVPAALGDGSQTRVIEINREVDPLFARQIPQPFESGLARLRKLVRESESHLGMAFSSDGRSLGVVDNQGDLVPALDLAVVIGTHLSHQYRQRGTLIVPPGSNVDVFPGGARGFDETYGLRIEQPEAPEQRIRELVERDRANLVVGITNQGEITLGRYSSVPDALLTALVLTEAVARSGLKLRALLNSTRGRA
ncbi:MAG TPA: phosphoglucomutase [Roseiflexaceae bacterium]|nr:phosphoglucomutase [Roseiflexaceae bacterium]